MHGRRAQLELPQFDGHSFVVSPTSLDIFASYADGSTTLELFDAGNNTLGASTSGTITSPPSLLDISFP